MFHYLFFEGALAMAFEIWLGPTYLSGLAGELGASVPLVTLLISLPWIGSIGQVLGIFVFDKVESIKRYAIVMAILSRTLWVIPFFCAFQFGLTSKWLIWTAMIACISSLFASSGAISWLTWMRALVPKRFRGRFFGARQSYVMATQIIANLLAFFCVKWKPHGYFAGYGILCVLALLCGWGSALLLARVPDVKIKKQSHSIWNSIREILRDLPFKNLLIFWAILNGVIQMTGPFFPYYFTKDLKIPMSRVALWIVIANSGYLLTARWWGKKIDRTGSPQNTLFVSSLLVACSPLLYFFVSSPQWVCILAPFEFFMNGIAWAGFYLSIMTLLLQRVPEEKTTLAFSLFAGASGLSSGCLTFLGGKLAQELAPYGGFRVLWLIGSLLRFVVLGLFFTKIFRAKRVTV